MPHPSQSSWFNHPKKKWVKYTDHYAHHYVISSTPLLPLPS
jgi:hypothetical protein